MPPRATKTPTVEALLPPILALLQPPSPNPYSAHQKALTTTARISNAHPDVAVEILFNVARELLKLGEGGSGSELGVKMVDVLSHAEKPVDDKTRANITQLLALAPSQGPWRKKLADAAIKWTAQHGECPTGDPALHQYLGELFYKDRQFIIAESHLLAAGTRDGARLLADMMFDWCEYGSLDPGPYALRGTLPFLTHQPPNILPASTFLTTFLSHLSSSRASTSAKGLFSSSQSTIPSQGAESAALQVTSSPSLNFCQLALMAVQRAPAVGTSAVEARGMTGGMGREWQALCGRYTRSSGASGVIAQREVQEALSQIATNVFLIPAPRGQNDMLQSLMGSLFGGGGGR